MYQAAWRTVWHADMDRDEIGVYVVRTENRNLNINASVLTDDHATPDALLASY